MRHMKVIFTHGAPASGKSTFAYDYQGDPSNGVTMVIERDRVRAAIQGVEGGRPDWSTWKWKNEKEVTRRCDAHLELAFSDDLVANVILADTNLDLSRVEQKKDQILALAGKHNVVVTFEHRAFYVPLDILWERDAKRHYGVGQKVVYEMYQKFLDNIEALYGWVDISQFADNAVVHARVTNEVREYKYARTADTPKDLPYVVIVDIDGTIADMEGIRGPFEWDRVYEDRVRHSIVAMVNAIRDAYDATVIVMSGRDGVAYDESVRWLRYKSGLKYDLFYIRSAGDPRKDSIVKRELYFKHVFGQYKVLHVIDDRPQVCREWRNLGLDVIQVADPHKEF